MDIAVLLDACLVAWVSGNPHLERALEAVAILANGWSVDASMASDLSPQAGRRARLMQWFRAAGKIAFMTALQGRQSFREGGKDGGSAASVLSAVGARVHASR